jgi:O-antigen ligase
MSIRVGICFLLVLALCIGAWRNWFPSLCGAIVLMAVLEHPDMPKNIGGIQGLNFWNILMANVLLAWYAQGAHHRLAQELPRGVIIRLSLYVLVIVTAWVRMMISPAGIQDFTIASAVSEQLINCIKWMLPGLLLFDGCRTRSRVLWALGCVLTLYFLLAVQIVRWVPLSLAVASGADLARNANKMCLNEIGYHRVNLSMMMSGASWAMVAALVVVKRPWSRLIVALAGLIVILGQSLTGGRAGYVAWGVVGLILSLVRWRRLLPLLPPFVLGIGVLLPGVRQRFLQGFGAVQGNVVVRRDAYEMTAGRTLIWPYVIEKIGEAPVFGYGREAMQRTGLSTYLWQELGEGFGHPHNAYFELLLDNGVVGTVLVLPFYLLVLTRAFSLFRDREDDLCSAVGGVVCALVLALLAAALGSQTFYPREGAIGMWAAMGIMLRVYEDRERARAQSRETLDQVSRAADGAPAEETAAPVPV